MSVAPASAETLPSTGESPLPIYAALGVNQVGKINDQAGTFEMTFDLTTRWRDLRLKFDAKENGGGRRTFLGDEADLQLKRIWTPQLIVRNMNGNPARVEHALFVYADGAVVHIERIKAIFDARFRMQSFPFDSQYLPIRILSNKYDTNQIVIRQSQQDIDASGLKPSVSASGFKIDRRLDFKFGRDRGLNGMFFPALDVNLKITRDPSSHLTMILTPFLALLLIPTLLTLYAKADVAPRLTAWAASILALIALSFTFSIRYPHSRSDGMINSMVSAGFGYQLIMLAISMLILYQPIADKITAKLGNKHVLTEIERYIKWAIPVGFASLLTAIVLLTKYQPAPYP
ncbi:MAG: hypothetical protein HY042_11010 [Spirochaetia bacterium]|nr:hypothetical protein [Spirochaetia bacterium]